MTTLRPINPTSDAEINLVAQRMRLTLIEVEGDPAQASTRPATSSAT